MRLAIALSLPLALRSFDPWARESSTKLRKKRFSEVYRLNLWGSPESRSGRGSEKRVAAPDRKFLYDSINRHYSSRASQTNLTIIDAPCGDFNWMPALLAALEEKFASVTYHGFDIVPSAIKTLRQRWASRPNYHFHHSDLVESVPAQGDVLICRDLLNHVSLRDGQRVLSNLLASHTPLLVISNNAATNSNAASPGDGGGSRFVDITKAPFNWPRPSSSNGHLSVWSMSGGGLTARTRRDRTVKKKATRDTRRVARD